MLRKEREKYRYSLNVVKTVKFVAQWGIF